MTETQTHQALIGDDGELTAPTPEQTGDESVYAALPQLFLLDPAHAAYIAGKKTKLEVKKTPSWITDNHKISVLLFGGILLCIEWALSVFLPSREPAANFIEVAFLITFGFLITAIVFLVTSVPFSLMAREKEMAKRRLFAQGMLLKGEVTNYRRKSRKRRVKPLTRADLEWINYRFTTPQGRRLKTAQSFYGEWRTEQDSTPIRVGTPVAVLYLSDKNYILL